MLLFLPNIATAQMVVYDPVNHVQNVITAINTVKQLLEDIKQVEMMVKMLKKYEDGSFQNVLPLFSKLRNAMETGKSLAYSMDDIDSEFRRKFPGYVPTKDYNEEYSDWVDTTLDTLRGSLNTLHIQSKNLNKDEALMEEIEVLSNGAVGTDQVLQAGNMMSSQMVKQVMKLRELMLAQANSQQVYMANQVNSDAQAMARLRQWLRMDGGQEETGE